MPLMDAWDKRVWASLQIAWSRQAEVHANLKHGHRDVKFSLRIDTIVNDDDIQIVTAANSARHYRNHVVDEIRSHTTPSKWPAVLNVQFAPSAQSASGFLIGRYRPYQAKDSILPLLDGLIRLFGTSLSAQRPRYEISRAFVIQS